MRSSPAAGGARVRVCGVRHHGPGSARAVLAALESLQPDVVLLEGPADADPLVALAGAADMEPPVALLAHVTGEPRTSAFWPFAVFSPEWQALRWAVLHGVPVRFCDLPAAAVLAMRDDGSGTGEPEGAESGGAEPGPGREDGEPPRGDGEEHGDDGPRDGAAPGTAELLRADPLAALAAAAGYDDPERWWDDVVESRLDAPAPFDVITDAMAAVREHAPALPAAEEERETRREAHMRQVLRAVLKEGAQRVAVVCGAWHAPALSGKLPPAAADARTLRGLPRRRVSLTWVPWTHSRLAAASGYGAGVDSPGWYHHLFTSPDEPVTRWLIAVAGVLRAEDLPVSTASVIEAVRLADALAVMRGRPLAGLAEVTEATRAVLCEGDESALHLVTRRLVVGEALGRVPAETPAVPLDSDLRATAKALRLKLDPLERTLELDLRKDTDLARSRLLHRLALLGVDWGRAAASLTRSTGTFRETWQLVWRPELAVDVIEASVWGTTVEAAATARAVERAGEATLPQLTALVERCLLAGLPQALPPVLRALDVRAAADADVEHLMTALPPLVRAHRYSDVRRTGSGDLAQVADALLVRVCAALPAAVVSLDDDAARDLRRAVDAVHEAVGLWEDPRGSRLWSATLAGLVAVEPGRQGPPGLLAGRIVRLLRDSGDLPAAEAARRLGFTLSRGTPAPAAAGWVEGFLGSGGGTVLVHDEDLLALLDAWVCSLPEREFTDVLPLLRRTFGGFAAPERRALGDALRRGSGARRGEGRSAGVDEERAAPALRTAAMLLGVPA
ncbi:DUF5682 family protein [Kineococcus xinjiangensis]|uniref:DUF5682 family protein n=1 Tax=Kineococcus xinjiangensis TaxID=512762 RepID=UPI000CECB8FD